MTKSASCFYLALTTLLLFGCAQGDYGRFDFKMSVSDMFESGQILENHTYYYIGPDAEPVAIMAIDNKYSLAPSLWKKADITPAQLSTWNMRIDNEYRIKNRYKGAIILDENGNRLGVWYSHLDWTTIKRGEGNTVIIFTPDTTKHLNKGSASIFGSK